MLNFEKIKFDDITIFKLVTLFNLTHNISGSMGDVAASLTKGITYYQKFNSSSVKELIANHSIVEIINADWDGLVIKNIIPKASINIFARWTGECVDTKEHVKLWKENKDNFKEEYSKFVSKSNSLVTDLAVNLSDGNTSEVLENFRQLRNNLHYLESFSNIPMETITMKKYIDTYPAGKQSGSGSGDIVLGFDNYAIDYNSIPRFGLADIDTSTTVCGTKWDFPFFINAITAGGEDCNKINNDFVEISKITGIEFFPGSYSPALKNKEDADAYPKGYSVNLGLDKEPSLILKAITDTNARYLQMHTNPLQEIVLPEGDHNFESWLTTLQEVSENSTIPVILKETGFGMNEETIKLALDLKLAAVDVSGMGGTNFARIENGRRDNKSVYLENIGYTTAESLENAYPYRDKIDIIASGGIRNPLDVVKCLALGAKAVGVSKIFLDILVNDGKETLIEEIEKWKKEIKFLMVLMNAKTIQELDGKIRKIN